MHVVMRGWDCYLSLLYIHHHAWESWDESAVKICSRNKSSTVKRHQGMRVGQQVLSPPDHQENNSDESIMSLLRHESVVEFEGLIQTPRCTNHLLTVKINML